MVDYYYKSFYMLFKISGIAVDFTKKKNVKVRVSTSPEGLAVQVFWVFFFFLLNDSSILKTCVKSSPAD